MREDEFFDNLNFESLRDYSGGPEINQYQVHLDECAIKGQKIFITPDADRLTLYTKQEFLNCDDEQFERDKYLNSKSEFILCGDEFTEEIDSPLDLEEALNSWGVY